MKQKQAIRIALVGDHDESVPAHQAIPVALDRVAGEIGIVVEFQWIPTPDVGTGEGLEAFEGIWCVPASPYRDMDGALETHERYRCRYGLRKELEAELFAGPLKVSGYDHGNEVRAMELNGHPFFLATLFQPERAALEGTTPPLVKAFVLACAQHGGSSQ
jgi:CTP synthase (UTP-ammonia lyase)